MKRFLLFFVLFCSPFFLHCGVSSAASSVVRSPSSDYITKWNGLDVSVEAWTVTSHSDGVVSAVDIGSKHNSIAYVEVVLDETLTPVAVFNLYLKKGEGTIQRDILGGSGVGLSYSEDSLISPMVGGYYSPSPTEGKVYLSGTSMGDGHVFTIFIAYLEY